MVHGYHGSVHVCMGAANVPLYAVITIDDPAREDWNAIIDNTASTPSFPGKGDVHIILLEGPDQGFAALGEFRPGAARTPLLRGRCPFGRSTGEADRVKQTFSTTRR